MQAVVGAGAAGLVAARELMALGHQVTVYEKTNSIGGVWAYTEETEDDPLGLNPNRKHVHGSMYKNLRTNLPREVMGVGDFPFDDRFPGSTDPRRYCSHEEVFRYLKAYAEHYDVLGCVRLGNDVAKLTQVHARHQDGNDGSAAGRKWTRWNVEVVSRGRGDEECVSTTVMYDAVVVCNGHYSKPRVPQWPGQDVFPGKQMHSHNYRHPEPFSGKRVLVVGAAFSGSDISQELLENGADVFLSARSWEDLAEGRAAHESEREIVKVGNVKELKADGSVLFVDGNQIENVDVVLYATGYLYSFPFLEDVPGAPDVEENRVAPLYKHVFPPALAPTLSFIGLPWKIVPFPQFQLQARWIGSCLNCSSMLPSQEDMQKEVKAWYDELDKEGIEKRYTHRMSPETQGSYNTWLAEASHSSEDGWPDWRRDLYIISGINRRQNGVDFREHELVGAESALRQFKKEAHRIRSQWKVTHTY